MYVLKHKSEVLQKFKEWKALVETSSGHKLKILRTDNGGGYCSKEFEEYCKREGVRHELTVPKTPEQNGVAERMNRTLVESVRSMLTDSMLPKQFWAEALSTAVYLRNRSPTKAVTGMTPFEAWTGEKPSVDHLRTFGCTAYAKDERKKLDSKARKYILLGYGNETKGYRLYDPIQSRVIHSRDVLFNEFTRGVEKERIEEKKQLELSLSNSSEEEPMINEDERVAGQFEEEETHSEGEAFIIGVYVDDIILAGKSEKKMPDIKKALSDKFEMKDLGELHYFLGVKVIQDRKKGTIWIGQPVYTENILQKFGMENAKPISTPVAVNTKLMLKTEDSEYFDKETYQSAVGSLLYLSTSTRPDITFAANNIARFSSNPTTQHWTVVKRIFRYLKGTIHLGLLYERNGLKKLIGYSDADWGGDCNDHKSTLVICS